MASASQSARAGTYAALLRKTSSQLRDEQESARLEVLNKSSAEGNLGISNTGEGSHMYLAAAAFRDGESATDEKEKRKHYARAVLEYRDALEDINNVVVFKEGPGPFSQSEMLTGADAENAAKEGHERAEREAEALKQAAKNAVNAVGGGLSDLVVKIAIAYFVTEALKSAFTGSLRRA